MHVNSETLERYSSDDLPAAKAATHPRTHHQTVCTAHSPWRRDASWR